MGKRGYMDGVLPLDRLRDALTASKSLFVFGFVFLDQNNISVFVSSR